MVERSLGMDEDPGSSPGVAQNLYNGAVQVQDLGDSRAKVAVNQGECSGGKVGKGPPVIESDVPT